MSAFAGKYQELLESLTSVMNRFLSYLRINLPMQLKDDFLAGCRHVPAGFHEAFVFVMLQC